MSRCDRSRPRSLGGNRRFSRCLEPRVGRSVCFAVAWAARLRLKKVADEPSEVRFTDGGISEEGVAQEVAREVAREVGC